MRLLRRAVQPLISADTYLRWVYLVLGGVLFVPFALAVLVLVSLVGPWNMSRVGEVPAALMLSALVIAAVLGAVTVLPPGVHRLQVQLSRALLGGRLAAEPETRTLGLRSRLRGACWLSLHFLVGIAVAIATMVVLSDAATLALRPVTERPGYATGWRLAMPVGPDALGVPPLFGPLIGAAVLAVFVYAMALAGAAAAGAAPWFLGASAADRLAAVQARADELAERNRLAAELHDSIGHALSVVALQAGAAARVIDADPGFARSALDAIADQARTATAELDHVLGLLRAEQAGRAPQRTLADLPHLAGAAAAAGTDVDYDSTGPLDDVPPVLSRELYRICQEGVTNALRHGKEGGTVTVRVRAAGGRLCASVANPIPERHRTLRRIRGGRGLAGMAERVRLLGGELRFGEDAGTWTLEAEIPWKSER